MDASMDISMDMLERVNPVFNTAKMTLFQLASAHDPDAAALVEELGLTLEETQGDKTEKERLNNSIMLEIRYRTMGAIAEKTGFTEVDLPCGYTPRAIEFARKGKPFVGIDLPATILEAEPAITALIDEDKRSLVRFAGADATNYESLQQALAATDGPVCITTEGLFMYLTDSEAAQFLDNIRRILDEHGGCWVTPDPETTIQYVLISQVVLGDDFMATMTRDKQHAQSKSDVSVSSRTLVVNVREGADGIRKAMAFLAAHGLRAERLIVGEHAPELESIKELSADQQAALAATMERVAYWKITPTDTPAATPVAVDGVAIGDFDLTAELDGENVLTLHLKGRLDTLSAPNLLTFFERQGDVHAVVADCADLAYVSSAGLRTFMIMRKKTKGGVTVRNANATIREILEQTAFDTILEIEE